LDEASRLRLLDISLRSLTKGFDLAIVIADGLSALAVDRHALPLVKEFLSALTLSLASIPIAPFCIVQQGRVAIGDEIADIFGADLVVVLIGERPGLSSPDSLGAYITWKPKPGRTTDAERNCISNIRGEGLSYIQAASRLVHYIREARTRGLTGVALKDPETEVARELAGPSSMHEDQPGVTL
jgi:ethanolamine ammonia-lyase small subunit